MLKLHHDIEEPACRLCGCTDGARCSPEGCLMVYDPFGGDLCAGCLDRVGEALAQTLAGLAAVVGGAEQLAGINERTALLVAFTGIDTPPPLRLAVVAVPA